MGKKRRAERSGKEREGLRGRERGPEGREEIRGKGRGKEKKMDFQISFQISKYATVLRLLKFSVLLSNLYII